MDRSTPQSRPVFTIRQAAERCGVSMKTIRRRRERGDFPNAYQDKNGHWLLPVEDLLAAGFHPAAPQLTQVDSVDTPVDTGVDVTHGHPVMSSVDVLGHEEVADLRVEIEKERGLRLAAEREVQAITAHLATAQGALKMIEAAPPQVETRIERVEVPVVERVEVPQRVEVPVIERVEVTPRWVWPTVAVALLVVLVSLTAGWALSQRVQAAPKSQATTSTPLPDEAGPAVSIPTVQETATEPPAPEPSGPIPIEVDPPPTTG